MSDRLLLVGMMGVGKTTIGRRCATRLGWRHFDSDAQVMADTGLTVPEIFAQRGEAAFRAEERRVLVEALGSAGGVVVSVAGGVVLDADNRDLLRRSGLVVWLRADPATLADRVGGGEGRPLLDDDPAAALVALEQVRRPLYQEVATAVIDVDSLTPDQVVERVLAVPGMPGTGAGAADPTGGDR